MPTGQSGLGICVRYLKVTTCRCYCELCSEQLKVSFLASCACQHANWQSCSHQPRIYGQSRISKMMSAQGCRCTVKCQVDCREGSRDHTLPPLSNQGSLPKKQVGGHSDQPVSTTCHGDTGGKPTLASPSCICTAERTCTAGGQQGPSWQPHNLPAQHA